MTLSVAEITQVIDVCKSMWHWWNDTNSRKQKHSKSNLSQCHSVRQ